MHETIIVRETFSSRDDAEEARERLEYGGFARNSIDITRIGDQFELAMHTRPENRRKAQDLLDGSDYAFEARRYGREIREHAPSASQSLLLIGGVAAIGAALYYAFSRQRDIYAQTYSSRQRSAVRGLYQAHREEDQRRVPARSSESGRRQFVDRPPGFRSDAAGYGA